MTKVVIVGCGVVGAAIAYELSLVEGLDITVLDQKTPASGSTGAALGVLMGVISRKTKGRAWRLRQASLQRYHSLINELEVITGKNLPVNRQGILKLLFAGDEQDKWEKLVPLRYSQGWRLEIWQPEQLQTRCPQLAKEQIIGAIYSPDDQQIAPRALTQALVIAATSKGVNFQFGVRVNKIPHQKNRCTQIQTNSGNLELDWLIIAAGIGSKTLANELQQPLSMRPVLGQALQLKLDQACGDPLFQPVITGNDVHIIPVGQGEYWVGATVEFPNDADEVVANPVLLKQIYHQAIAFCPALAQAQITRTWSGQRPRPEGRGAPIIEQLPGYQNVLLATGHYRNGILLAPATALEIRDWLIKQ